MIRLYESPTFQVAWRTYRDLHPLPMSGYELLPVAKAPWWRIAYIRRGFIGLYLGIGALSIWWRT